MKDALGDIKQKLRKGRYKNEEHIRLSLVARVLLKLGWNVWDPDEVNCEYNTVPNEDSSRVDMALFLTSRKPNVFIEVKAIGKISSKLAETELQLRNYNRDNTAQFSIITDGRKWRFYLSQTGGKFREKCFKVVDLLDDDLDDIANSLSIFLGKANIKNGVAQDEAQKYLWLTEKQRVLGELLPKAKRKIQVPPYPSLPEALIELIIEESFVITKDEVEEFLKKMVPETRPTPAEDIKEETPEVTKPMKFPATRSPSLRFTKIIEAAFAARSATNWNALLRSGVEVALQQNISIGRLKSLSVPVAEGRKTNDGFCPVSKRNVSVQNVDANRAWSLSLILAKELNVEIKVKFRWREKDGATYPGKLGQLHWKP